MCFQVDDEDGGLSDAQIKGDAGRDTSWAWAFFRWRQAIPSTAEPWGDVGQDDHGPEHGASEIGYQLHINGVGHRRPHKSTQAHFRGRQ